jgi:excisionase family DNA binding protein
MKRQRNNNLSVLPDGLCDRLENMLTTISKQRMPERIHLLEERVDQLNCVEELTMRLDQLEGTLWLSKNVLTSTEAALYLGIAESYLYKLTSKKKIPHYKPNGRCIYFNKEELSRWALQNPVSLNENVELLQNEEA